MNNENINYSEDSMDAENGRPFTTVRERQVYLASDIQKTLGIGRSTTYEYLEEVYKKQKPFRVIKIGKLFRIPKLSFDAWLNGTGA